MAFDFDFDKEANLRAHIKSFFLHPEYWSKKTQNTPVKLEWKRIKFKESNLKYVPDKVGVYAFVLVPDYSDIFETRYLFYIGKTYRELKTRFKEYINEQKGKGKPRKKVYKMLNQYEGNLYFYCVELDGQTEEAVSRVEETLLNTFIPHVNTSIPEAKIQNELKNIYEGN